MTAKRPVANPGANPGANDDRQAGAGSQAAAADPTQSVWVAANAGTGKTHVLIDRVMRLLLAHTPPERILCLTFTRAAAAEMTNRLSQRLGKWSVMNDTELMKELSALLDGRAEEEMLDPARRLFARTLEVPGGLKVQTLHAFCESLLRRFPLEAGIAPHFSVMDERTAAELLSASRDHVLARAFDGDEPLAAAIDHVAGLVDEEGFLALMAELSFNRGRLERMMARQGGLDAMMAAVYRALGLDRGTTPEDVAAAAAADGAFDRRGLLGAARALDQGTPTDKARAADLRAWLDESEGGRAAGFAGSYAAVFLTQKDEPRKSLMTAKARAVDEGAVDEGAVDEAAEDVLLAEQARVLKAMGKVKAAGVARATTAILRLGAALLREYGQQKATRALLDYDDLIRHAGTLLKAEGGASWVLYKLDGGLDHILVDEAQDTSPEQWQLVAALADEFFSGQGARDQTRTLFVVGDEKQSIYSFQGADPEAFDVMRAHFAARVRQGGHKWAAVELLESRRSVAAVLNVIDGIFAQPLARDGLTSDTRPIRHPVFRAGQAGLVELWPTLTVDEAPPTDPWEAPLDRIPTASPQARLAERIAETIDGWIKNKEPLASRGQPMEAGDIMILVRTRTRFVEEMVRCLKRKGVPVAGTDRMVLTDQLAVMDLMAVGNAVLLPEDDLNLAVVLKGPLIGLDESQLFDLAQGRRGSLGRALEERRGDNPQLKAAGDFLARLRARADTVPPYEFFARLLSLGPGDVVSGRQAMTARLGHDAADPMDEFLSLALDFENSHAPSLQSFLHWLGAGRTEIKRDLEHGKGEVRVMTVHGAKGLQANVVILPDTCTVPGARQDSRLLWRMDDDDPVMVWPVARANEVGMVEVLRQKARDARLHEHRRLFYVAATRARDRLYICGYENKKGRGDGCWYDLAEDVIKDAGQEITGADGGLVWRVETPQEAPPEGGAAAATFGPPPELPAWARRAPPPEPEPAPVLAPSRPAGKESGAEPGVFSPLADDGARRFLRGRLIHRLLQSLPDIPPHARAQAAAAFVAAAARGEDDKARRQMADEIVAETLAVLDHEDFAAIFGPGSRAEVPLVGEVSGVVISAQVDRLLVTEDAITVIDYKTNRPPPERPGDVAAVYLRQMAAYRAALRRIYPDRPVNCLLLWTDGPRAMALPGSLLDPYAP